MRRKKLGEYIRYERTLRRMTLQQLAALCQTSVSHISRMERGVDNMTIDLELLSNIANSFDIPLERILLMSGYVEEKRERMVSQEIKRFLQQPAIQHICPIVFEELEKHQIQDVYTDVQHMLHILSFKYKKY